MQNWKKFPRATLFTLLVIGLCAGLVMPRIDQAQAAPKIAPLYACSGTTIAQWTFTNISTPSTGSGTFSNGSGLTGPFYLSSSSIYFSGWTSAASLDTTDYMEFQVDTTGRESISFDFNYRATGTGPTTLEFQYSTDGTSFTSFGSTTLTKDSNFYPLSFDLSSITLLANNSAAKFRIYAYGSGAGNFGVDDVTVSGPCIPPPAGSGDISITSLVNNSSTPVNVQVCENLVFAIAVKNEGSSDATNITVNGSIPPSTLQYVSDSGVTTYNTATGNWTWIVDIAAGTTQTLYITVNVVNTGTSITSHAAVLNSTNVNDAADSVVNSIVGNNADLSISQEWRRPIVGTDASAVADTAILKITVVNNGPSVADGIYIEDKLSAGLTSPGTPIFTPSSSGMTYNSSTGIWSVGSLGVGNSAIMELSVKVDEDGVSADSTAKVKQANQCDVNAANNESVSHVLISNLSLTLSGNTLGTIFTITVTNAGPDTATGVKVKTPLTGYTHFSNNSTGSGGTFTYDSGKSIWVWDLVSPMLKNTTRTLTITTAPVTAGVYPENTAEIYAVNEVDFDSVPNNNSSTENDRDRYPVPLADLVVTQTVDNNNPDPADVAGTGSNFVTFTVRVANSGTSSTGGVKILDLLPSGLTYVSPVVFSSSPLGPATSGMSYSSSSGVWTVGTLANGAWAEMKLKAKVTANGKITNTAKVQNATEKDPDTLDNSFDVTILTYRAVIINEIAWAGTFASIEDEWIELYNSGAADIPITGWKLKLNVKCGVSGGDFIILSSSSGKIVKGNFYLLERDSSTTTTEIEDQVYGATTSNALPDAGATLYLCDDTGRFLDTANYEGSTSSPNSWPKGNETSYKFASMERQGTSSEKDSSWITNMGYIKNGRDANNDIIYGTPKKSNSTGPEPTERPIATPTIVPPIKRPVINEFLARPGFDWNLDGRVDVFDEFIEIKNIGVVNVELGGWQIDDGQDVGSSPFTLPALTLKPGERVVYYGLETNILLSDGGDTVRLMNSAGKVYDHYTYAIAKVEDQSVCRIIDGKGSWYEDCVPTPGQTNTRDGSVPSMPGGDIFESPVCLLPDTLPADFLFAECHGYGAGIWRAFLDIDWLWVQSGRSKQNTYFQ